MIDIKKIQQTQVWDTLMDLFAYSPVPKQDLNMLEQALLHMNHFHRYMDIYRDSNSIRLVLDIRGKELVYQFLIPNNDGSIVITGSDGTRAYIPRSNEASSSLAYCVNMIYEHGNLRQGDIDLISSSFTAFNEGVEQIIKDKRAGLYPELDQEVISTVRGLTCMSNLLRYDGVEVCDGGRGLLITHLEPTSVFNIKVRSTHSNEYGFYVLLTIINSSEKINRIISGSIVKVSSLLSSIIAKEINNNKVGKILP